MKPQAFSEYKLGNLYLKNRIVRSATYEGASDREGIPGPKYLSIYRNLAKNNAGMIITGFSFISARGRAMQPAQSGIESKEKIKYFRLVTDEVHRYNCPIIIQLAHTGRQTLEEAINDIPFSSTNKRSPYFRQKTKLITKKETEEVISQFINSAFYAKEAGFDGVQLHAGHGYLLNQFLLPETNLLKNEFGIDKKTGLGTKIIEMIHSGIKEKCGDDFPVMIKISGDHDLGYNFYPAKFDKLITFLSKQSFDAIEISCGTMDYSLNIFRGDLNMRTVFRHNPIYKTENTAKKFIYNFMINKFMAPRFREFSATYNLKFARRAKELTNIPVISVGGFRSKTEIEHAISDQMTDLVSMSRPFICEPDIVTKMIRSEKNYQSKCKNCNECVFMCDSGSVTKCYSRSKN